MAAIIEGKMQQHVVAIPYPAQGHITPMLQLCRQLAPHGFTFTFVNTHHIHQRVQRARPAHGSVHHGDQDALAYANEKHHMSDHDDEYRSEAHRSPQNEQGQRADLRGEHSSIRMVFVAGGCAPEEHARKSTWGSAFKAAEDMQGPVEQLLSRIMHEQAVAFILTDVMFSWSGSTAQKFSLPLVVLWPASAATCSMFLYFSDLAAEGKGVPIAEKEAGETGGAILEDIPGLPPTRLCDVPKVWDTNTFKIQHVVLRSFEGAFQKASYLILNTFEALEGQVLDALRKRLPTVAVGPLIPSHYMQLHNDVRFMGPGSAVATGPPESPLRLSLFPEDRTCLDWLDTKAPSSVLFISFGSISLRTEQQLGELALGVEASGCPFLWVRRPAFDTCADHSGRENSYEVNDQDRRREARHNPSGGLVVPWAPQLQVLSHPSVGGFITHCGWNSVVESVATGVPMLCWADTGERMSNQRFVVEFWKCGIDMVAGTKRVTQHIDDPVLVRREEVENSVRQLMYDEDGAPIRARAAELRGISKEAFVGAESSFRELVKAMELKRPAH